MRKDTTHNKVPRLRKWVWGGFAAGLVLLVGVGITVGILVANNQESSKSSQQSAAESSPPFISSNTTNDDTGNTDTTTPVPVIAIPITSVPSTTALRNSNNGTDAPVASTSEGNGTTFVPTVSSVYIDDTNTTSSSSAPAIVNPTTTTIPAPVPVVNTVTTPVPVPVVVTTSVSPTTPPAPTTFFPTITNAPTTTVFYAHGDIPYEAAQTVILEAQMTSVPLDAEFVIFVGDLRDAGDDKPCVAQEYADAAYYFRMSHAPVFVIQGDNDISDCPNYDEGKALWMNEFVGFESKYWNHTFNLQRQEGYPDNFAFVHKHSLFIGLNIIGGDTRDVTEWETRLRAEAEWTINLIRNYQMEYSMNSTIVGRIVIFGHANPGSRHASFFQAISTFINFELMNSIPIVYINGDKHEWMYTENFYDNPSWLRIGVTGLGAEPLLRVTVEADGTYIAPAQAYELERFI